MIGTIVVLALACAGLGAASVLQGPRIQGAQIDLAAAVVAPSPLRIVMNEAVAAIAETDITVTPIAPVTLQNDGNVRLVRFVGALEYDTTYRVDIAGVSAAAGGVKADLSHEFHTPAFTATWLQRSPSGNPDRIPRLRCMAGIAPTLVTSRAALADLPLRATDAKSFTGSHRTAVGTSRASISIIRAHAQSHG